MLLRLCKKVEIFCGLGGHGLTGFGITSCIVIVNALGSDLLSTKERRRWGICELYPTIRKFIYLITKFMYVVVFHNLLNAIHLCRI